MKKRSRASNLGLNEAPTLTPSQQEFADPMAYIESIRDIGRKYGIVKIVPPKFWKPDFAIDTQKFQFKTRKQRINEMNSFIRASTDFADRIEKYHEIITGLDVYKSIRSLGPNSQKLTSLYHLWKLVYDYGGPVKVSKLNKWHVVAADLEIPTIQAAKSVYDSAIQPYLLFCRKYRSLRQPTYNGCVCKAQHSIVSICDDFLNGTAPTKLTSCEDCGNEYHPECYKIFFRSKIPTEQIKFCINCVLGTGEFGFEDGGTYTLNEFEKKANRFKNQFFKVNDETDEMPSNIKYKVEKAFWSHFDNPNSSLEVEYGADIHNVTGFSTDPKNFYSHHPWNLMKLAKCEKSLLRFCTSDISGMTISWLYIGMCFSTFCWHAEDHFTYSINYQHSGDTKTWYGVPGHYADMLESAIKAETPDLLDQQPDLMLQLVTLISPAKLKNQGIQVFYIDQQENEFVVTFPRAYHAGFNHGFNINEAVNFALPNWVTENFARNSVVMYSKFARQPCFSNDELMFNIMFEGMNKGLGYSIQWLYPIIATIVFGELKQRGNCTAVVSEKSLRRLEQCLKCKAFLYLSALHCEGDYYCFNHMVQGKTSELWLRYTDDELNGLLDQFRVVAQAKPNRLQAWQDKFHKIFNSKPDCVMRTPVPLYELLELFSFAGDDNQIRKLDQFQSLQKKCLLALEWIEQFTYLFNAAIANDTKPYFSDLQKSLSYVNFTSPETVILQTFSQPGMNTRNTPKRLYSDEQDWKYSNGPNKSAKQSVAITD